MMGRWGFIFGLVLGEGFFDRDTLKFSFALGFPTFDGFVVREMLEVLWVDVGLFRLGFRRRVVLFCYVVSCPEKGACDRRLLPSWCKKNSTMRGFSEHIIG